MKNLAFNLVVIFTVLAFSNDSQAQCHSRVQSFFPAQAALAFPQANQFGYFPQQQQFFPQQFPIQPAFVNNGLQYAAPQPVILQQPVIVQRQFVNRRRVIVQRRGLFGRRVNVIVR